ncbi:MAG: efflux RND transporter permease subunit [Planctomycetota bacterium]
MRVLYQYAIRNPVRAVALGVVVTAATASGILRLQIRTDGNALVPQNAPEVAFDRQIRDRFGLEDPFAIVIRTDLPEGIFNAGILRFVKELTEACQKIEGVRPYDVSSLATEHSHRVVQNSLKFRRFLDPLPTRRKQLEQLREDLRKIRLYDGTLVSTDERATSILVGAPANRNRVELYRILQETIADKQTTTGADADVKVIGAPVAEALLGSHLLEDLGVPAAWLGHLPTSQKAPGFAWPQNLAEWPPWINRNVGLVPVAIVVMAIVFLLSFRNPLSAGLPLMEVGAAIAFVFGLMGYMGVPVYLTIAVLPVILTAIGIADEIHIYARFRELLLASPDASRHELALATMDEMYLPVVQTSLTTSIGFLSFSLSPIGAVQAFGVFTAIGVLFCMFWSLTVVPAMLVLFRRSWHRPVFGGRPGGSGPLSWIMKRAAFVVIALRWPLVLASIAFVALAPGGVRRIVVQDSWINGFAESSDFYQTTMAFNEDFLGTHLLLLVVECDHDEITGDLVMEFVDHHDIFIPGDVIDDPASLVGRHLALRIPLPPDYVARPGTRARPRDRSMWIEDAERTGDRIRLQLPRRQGSPKISMDAVKAESLTYTITPKRFLQPELIQDLKAFATYLRSLDKYSVGGALGPAEYIETTNLMARALKEESRRIPDNPERVNWLWAQFKRIRTDEKLHQLVDKEFATGIVTVFLEDANFLDTASLMTDIDAYANEHLVPKGIRVAFAGDVAVSQTLIAAIVSTQVRSVLISMVGVVLAATLLGRSLLFGLLAVLPCALAVLGNFAVMGVAGIPLGVATSMFAGMTLGIGVDFAIHLLARYREAMKRCNDSREAIIDAMVASGPAIIVDAIAVALGFGILMLSQVPANARLGVLVVMSLAGCLLATLLVLPALLALRRRTGTPSHDLTMFAPPSD